MDRPPWIWYGWGPYWNHNQQQPQPWYGWNPLTPWNQGTSFSNVGRNGAAPYPGVHMRPPSHNFSHPLGLGNHARPFCVGRPPAPRPPQPQPARVSLGVPILTSSGQHRGHDLGRDSGKGLLGPGYLSSHHGKTPLLPPMKRAELKSPQLHSQHGNGSHDNNSSDKSPEEKALDSVEETPDPPPASSTNETGLGSHVIAAESAPPPSGSSDAAVSMTQRNDQGDVFGLVGYFEKKRLLSTSSTDVEEEVKVARKKTRLGWGQGLAKYEKKLKEQNGQKPVADGDNGETGNEAIVYTANASASSDRPTPTPASNVNPGNNSTNTTEMMVSKVALPASSRDCSPPTGEINYRGNSSKHFTEIVSCPQLDVGGSSNPCNSSLSMTETVVSTITHGRSRSPGDIDDHRNISKSLAALSRNPLPGGNNDPCNSISSMTDTVLFEHASSHGCETPPAAGYTGGLGKRSMSLTEIVSSPVVPALSHRLSTSPPRGANGIHGNNSMSLLTEKVVRPADVLPPSGRCTRSPGDNIALVNSSTSLTATVIDTDTVVLASSEGFNLSPDGSSAKLKKVQDIPDKMISQPSNEIQDCARMPSIVVRKLQMPRKFLKNNNLMEEPQTNDLQGYTFKARSQEKKDAFSDKITTFGTDFTEISSFLPQKTPADGTEYYSKYYKLECSKKGNTRLPTTKQLQGQCKNVNDAVPYMSGIATVTATKNYKRIKSTAEGTKKAADKRHHVESSVAENEHVTGNVLVGEMNAPSLNPPITNSGQAISLPIPKTEVVELKNLDEDSYSYEENRKGDQKIWTKRERCHLNQAIEKHGMDFSSISVHVGTKSIQERKYFLSKCKKDSNLAEKRVNNNINSTISANDKSVSNIDCATCIIQPYSKVKGNVSQPVTSADHGDGKNYLAGGASGQGTNERIVPLSKSCEKVPNLTIDSNQFISGQENSELLCIVSEECNDAAEHSQNDTYPNSNIIDVSIASSEMENLRSDSNHYIATDGAQSSGQHEFVQPPEDSEAFTIGSNVNNDKVKRDQKYPERSIASKADTGKIGIVNSQKEKGNFDTIASLEGNDGSMRDSDGASNIFDIPPSTAPATLKTVYAKFYRGKVVDMNLPLDVAPAYVASVALDNNHAEPSMDPNEPDQSTHATAKTEQESCMRARASTDLGGDNEAANHVNHVQEIHQSHATGPETSHQPAIQPGYIMLFGQVICGTPSSGTNLTWSQGN